MKSFPAWRAELCIVVVELLIPEGHGALGFAVFEEAGFETVDLSFSKVNTESTFTLFLSPFFPRCVETASRDTVQHLRRRAIMRVHGKTSRNQFREVIPIGWLPILREAGGYVLREIQRRFIYLQCHSIIHDSAELEDVGLRGKRHMHKLMEGIEGHPEM